MIGSSALIFSCTCSQIPNRNPQGALSVLLITSCFLSKLQLKSKSLFRNVWQKVLMPVFSNLHSFLLQESPVNAVSHESYLRYCTPLLGISSWSLTFLEKCSSPNCAILHCLNVRYQIVVVPDNHCF